MDESERLKMSGIEQFREIYDAGNIGLIFIGMPGLEKKLSRYPQLYSRVGFAHQYRTVLSQEEMRFMLSHYWERLDLKMNPNDFTDAEARGAVAPLVVLRRSAHTRCAAIARITNGNFRLLNRLFRQIQRVINGLYVLPKYSGKRIGSKLLARVESIAKQKNIKLMSVTASLNAQSFYERLGYQYLGDSAWSISPGVVVKAISMNKSLT